MIALLVAAFVIIMFLYISAQSVGLGRPEKIGIAIIIAGLLLSPLPCILNELAFRRLWSSGDTTALDHVTFWLRVGYATLAVIVTGAAWLAIACARRVWINRRTLFPFAYRKENS